MSHLRVLLVAFCLSAASAQCAEILRIGVAVPLTGPYKLLGEQALSGAQAAAKAFSGAREIELVITDDRCNAAGGQAAARGFAQVKAAAAVGFLCASAALSAQQELQSGQIPLLTLGARADAVTPDAGSLVFRLGPASSQEPEAVSKLLLPLWRSANFAIIDDGTLHARELAETLRAAAEEAGLKPVYADTFRPGLENQLSLVNRLKKAGATHVFIGGDRDDIAIIARDAAERKYDLTIAGGEMLTAAPGGSPMPDGVIMVGAPPPEKLPSAQGVIGAALEERQTAEGYYLPAYAAIQIIAQSAADADKALATAIREGPHDTVIGPVRFGANGGLLDNPYRLLVSKAGVFQSYQ